MNESYELALRAMLIDRLRNQTREHWAEISILFLTADIVSALGLLGSCVVRPIPAEPRVLGIAIAATSIIAVVLGYFSIQAGSTFAVGPLRLIQVVSSLFVAATQIGLFLWPLHVLQQQKRGAHYILDLRWWLLVCAGFCSAGALANLSEKIARESNHLADVFDLRDFEKRQRTDRWSASGVSAGCLIAFLLTLVAPHQAFGIAITAVALAFVGMTFGVYAQDSTVKHAIAPLLTP